MITLGAIGFIFKRAFYFVVDNWQPVLCVVILVVLFFAWRSCSSRAAKLDIKAIEKINKANETERLKELEKVVVENAGVIKTVDERNTIAEVSEDERQAQIYAKIKDADEKIAAAKANGRDVTGPELECMLVPESCK